MNKYIFPVMLIILDVGAAVVYLFNGDVKKSDLLGGCGSAECLCNVLGGDLIDKLTNRKLL